MTRSLGVIGARGYVGRELLALVARHGGLDVRLETSKRDGLAPEDVARAGCDAYVLALPNGEAARYVAALPKDAVVVDLSTDHRLDPAWVYGQPDRLRARIRGARRIANPGCYATAMQLALAPLVPLLEGPAHVFGVSGYSGAGTTPSPKNDPENLRDNVLPYSLTGHAHEREVAAHLGCRLFFVPHVASFFRGLTVTVSVAFSEAQSIEALSARYREAYGKEPLVRLHAEPPLVRDVMERHETNIGGLSLSHDGRHAVVVATIDNLLGGAATTALRNLNLTLGFDELRGIDAAPR
jgi:N-acetyl-gamma-glutamyl-phosphate reductase